MPSQRAESRAPLAAILSADAKGYSRLMGEDEMGTVRTLTAYRAIMRDTIARVRGRVVDSPATISSPSSPAPSMP